MKNNFAVGNRCAINPNDWGLTVSREKVFSILRQLKFEIIGPPDIVGTARSLIGKAKYCRAARPSEAPDKVDCTSMIKWVYGQWGIWLPRRSVQQREFGQQICFRDLRPGDLVFTKGLISYYLDDPKNGVGHAGIVTEKRTVIHAAGKKTGVSEIPLKLFLNVNNYRGVRRIIPKNSRPVTVIVPADREIETADDIRWIVVQSLPVTVKKQKPAGGRK